MMDCISCFLSNAALDCVGELIEALEKVSCRGLCVKKADLLTQSRSEVALPYSHCLPKACRQKTLKHLELKTAVNDPAVSDLQS